MWRSLVVRLCRQSQWRKVARGVGEDRRGSGVPSSKTTTSFSIGWDRGAGKHSFRLVAVAETLVVLEGLGTDVIPTKNNFEWWI